MISALALLATALLFGGMVLYSFAFAAFLFSALPPEQAGGLLRRAFPHFYLFVIGASALSAALTAPVHPLAAIALVAVALTTVPARQALMPAINAASDTGRQARFKLLHGASVALTLAHIVLTGWALLRFLPA